MGCGFSKSNFPQGGNEEASSFSAISGISKAPKSGLNHDQTSPAASFRVFDEKSPGDVNLPSYAEYPPSVEVILGTLKAANNFDDNTLSSDAPKSAFNVLRSRHHHVWIDNNHRLPAKTKLKHGHSGFTFAVSRKSL